MAKLRHVAIQVPDLEKAAQFYETVFDMERVCRGDTPFGNVIMLSDGVMNVALLNFPEGTRGLVNGPDWAGMHHVGFVVDDAEATAKKIEEAGGSYHYTLEGDYEGLQAEEKYKDINGVVFDISEHGWATEPVGRLRKEKEEREARARETVPAE